MTGVMRGLIGPGMRYLQNKRPMPRAMVHLFIAFLKRSLRQSGSPTKMRLVVLKTTLSITGLILTSFHCPSVLVFKYASKATSISSWTCLTSFAV